MDRDNFLERVLEFLKSSGIRYCVIGGTGVNAYAYPVVTEDLDIVVAAEDIEAVEAALARHFKVRRFPHSINVSAPPSKLQVQIQTDPRYFDYVPRAEMREVMDYQLPVARIEDILEGKIFGQRWMQTAVKANGRRISPTSPESLKSLPGFAAAFRPSCWPNFFDLEFGFGVVIVA